MSITFKNYRRRDGSQMLYINRDNGVSIGISADHGFSPYGKGSTPGKRNAMAEAIMVMTASPVFTGDLAAHEESGLCAPAQLAGGWAMAGTDTATIGGMKVGSDGMYVIWGGHIVRCGLDLTEESA